MGQGLFSLLLLFNCTTISHSQNTVALPRTWDHLQLGDGLKQIQILYRPTRAWPSYVEPKGGVTRIRVERGSVKAMPRPIETLWLGMRKGKLVHLQVAYEAGKVEIARLVERLAADYGPPQEDKDAFWWGDEKTVLRISFSAAAGRTEIELMDAGLFERVD